MMKKDPDAPDTLQTLLSVVADLLRGKAHSRRTITESTGKSLPTADRWLDLLEDALPHVRRVRDGNTTSLVYDGHPKPSPSATTGACISASLGALFEGSRQERSLKDARDFVLRERGEAYADLDRKFVLAPRGGESALPEAGDALDEIIAAVLENRRLQFDYTHNSGESETLTIDPLSLTVFNHQFYVLTRKDDHFYPYRFARMKRVKKQEESFDYPLKGEYDPKAILAQSFGIHISGTEPVEEIEVILSGGWASYALTHRWHPTQRARKLEDGRVSVTLHVRLCREVESWALGFGEGGIVMRPKRLAKRIGERLDAAAAAYRTKSRSGPSLAKAVTKRPAANPQRKRRTK
jgi:predicted DNA-binding transcriptional regulator YafY